MRHIWTPKKVKEHEDRCKRLQQERELLPIMVKKLNERLVSPDPQPIPEPPPQVEPYFVWTSGGMEMRYHDMDMGEIKIYDNSGTYYVSNVQDSETIGATEVR
jgi:hypothetical protein